MPAWRVHRGDLAAREGVALAGAEFRAEGIADRNGVRGDPAGRAVYRLSGGERAARGGRGFRRHHRHGRKLDLDRLRPRGRLGIADHGHRLHAVAHRDLIAAAGSRGRSGAFRLRPYLSEGRAAMSAALIIDIILWGSVAAVGFIAFRRGRKVLTTAMREGTMDFINIV